MAHFAQLNNNNEVIDLVVVANEAIQNLPFPESEPVGVAFLDSLLGPDKIWKQTSYNNTFRKNFASANVGCIYDPQRDAFIYPSLFPSWVLDEQTCKWVAPVPYPSDDPSMEKYYWDEPTLSWVLCPQ